VKGRKSRGLFYRQLRALGAEGRGIWRAGVFLAGATSPLFRRARKSSGQKNAAIIAIHDYSVKFCIFPSENLE
jgi:hypothetical protein